MPKLKDKVCGFTLVELLVVIAIIGIISAIAIPQYSDYVTRSKFTEAHSTLADARVKLEQRFMDNRTFAGGAGTWTCGTPQPVLRYFTYTCAGTASTYTITATGIAAQGLSGIAFTINESNTRATTITAGTTMANAGYASNTTCWLTKKGVC